MSDQPTPSPESLAAKHETTDVQSKPLVVSALVLAVAVACVCLFLIWFFDRLETRARRRDPQISPLAESQTPPTPRLQTSPANDVAQMRAAEERALGGYRWIDKERGVVQLPIERAMELLVEEGLPKTGAEVPMVGPDEESRREAAP